ncbi:MAG: hypothetical protein GTN53_41370 [Candidatus Aminicenantes bacterium]|nr:hypothetical protein [Candidatus Aminicenantes bacterium]
MGDILGITAAHQCPTNNDDGHEKRQTIKHCPENSHRKLNFKIIGCPFTSYQVRISGHHGQPITQEVDNNKKHKKLREKIFHGTAVALVKI